MINVTVRADEVQGTVYHWQTMSCEELCTRGEAVYIYMSLRGQVCARVIATLSHNNAPGQYRDTSFSVL